MADEPIVEQKSRFKITMNAKHEPQWELSVVAGETAEELDRLRLLAVSQHEQLRSALLGGSK